MPEADPSLAGKTQMKNSKILTNKNYFHIFVFVFFIFGFLFFVLVPQSALAQVQNQELMNNLAGEAGLTQESLPIIIIRIVRWALAFLGLIAVIIVIYGGFVWMTSKGIPDKIAKAKKILIAGLIGLAIIIFAYAIVSFVMQFLGEIGGPPGGSGCEIGQISGCYRCVGPEPHWQWDPTIPGCSFPPDAFKIDKIVTTHGGPLQSYHQDVYLCSAIQPIFNHWVDSEVIDELSQAGDLRIEETGGEKIDGIWQTRTNTVIFKHPEIFEKNTRYQGIFPKYILDTGGRQLQRCLASGSCNLIGNNFIWPFQTGVTSDEQAPYIVSSYPIFDQSNPNYPDKNVSRKPLIQVNFSEPIDATTVIDKDNNLIGENIWLEKIREGAGSEVVPNTDWLVEIKEKGFNLQLKEDKLLEAFTHYKIYVSNIADLCNNLMDPILVEWEFWTNDQAPGIRSWYPTGDKECPDVNMAATFNTQMYENTVKIKIVNLDNGQIIGQAEINPSVVGSPYEVQGMGGLFKVLDPADPVNNKFRAFQFNPDNYLDNNTNYQVFIETDLIINQQGDTLEHNWTFKTATPEDCLCSPWISYLNPQQGPAGQCITAYGQCFMGADNQPAIPTKIEFILEGLSIEGAIGGYDKNYITTTVPETYQLEDRPEVQATITYQETGDQLVSNREEFYVNQEGVATGPCLWSVNPNWGYPGETKIKLSGIRFGQGGREDKVRFYDNKDVPASQTQWSDKEISDVLVPLGVEDGDLIVINAQGTSNALPFDVRQHQSGPGEVCLHTVCPNNINSCQEPVYSCLVDTNDCRCCCTPLPNSCQSGLECLANMGDCTSDNRGLCCGCQNDNQCGGGLNGCGFLDPNRCCYAKPTVINYNPTGSNVCLNTAINIEFNQEMDRNSLNKDNIKLFETQTGNNKDFNIVVGAGNKILTLYPKDCRLEPLINYQVSLIGGANGQGIRSNEGVSMNNFNWQFTTGEANHFCEVDSIIVNPNQTTIQVGETKNYSATAYDEENKPVCVASFDWRSEDVQGTNVASVEPLQGLETVATGTNRGQARIYAAYTEQISAVEGYGQLNVLLSNLKVAESSICNPGEEYPSPNPRPNFQDACVNIKISARFNKLVNDNTVPSNVTMEKCLNSECSQVELILGLIQVNNYNEEQEQFIFTPQGNLETDTKYQITVKGGENGIIGEDNSTMISDYVWQFRTRDNANVCPINAVQILPLDWLSNSLGEEIDYQSEAIDQNCQILTGSHQWQWAVVDKEGQLSNVARVEPTGPGNTTTATTQNWGEAYIQAATENKNGQSYLQVRPRPQIESTIPENGAANVCRNTLISATFDQEMDRDTLGSSTVRLYKKTVSGISCPIIKQIGDFLKSVFIKIVQADVTVPVNGNGWQLVSTAVLSYNIEIDNQIKTVVTVIPDNILDSGEDYKVVISDSVTSQYGVEMGSEYSWQFTAGSEICSLNKVEIEPSFWLAKQKDESKNFTALAYDNQGNMIQGLPGYNWTWSWTKVENPEGVISNINPTDNNPTVVTVDNKNGSATLTATATISEGGDGSVSGSIQITVFLCENPWPENPPYNESTTNFEFYYCRDNNPLLPILTGPQEGPVGGNLIKNLLFGVADKNDVIGSQVYKNPDHLSPLEWYSQNVPNPGNITSLFIDGYQAIQSGRTVYVGATNVNLSGPTIDSNIYLISYNDGASQETVNIFSQLINNWHFNTNKNEEGVYLISNNDKSKIQRDLIRLYGINTIAPLLETYKNQNNYYPKLEAGTYISGFSTSRWPSWQQTLAQELGQSLPIDPINQFVSPCADCPENNPDCDGTCYNADPNQKQYECLVGSQVYQYKILENGEKYNLYLNLEYNNPSIWRHYCNSYNNQEVCSAHHWCEWQPQQPAENCVDKNLNYSSNPCNLPSSCQCFNTAYRPAIEGGGMR